MSRLFVLVVLAACSSSSSSKPPSAALEGVIAANATNVSKFSPLMVFQMMYAKQLPQAPAPCWNELTMKIVAGYEVHLNVRPARSYFVVEGDLPRAGVSACVPQAFGSAIQMHDEGELTVLDMTGTKAYAAWRGRYIVLGSKQEVLDALATPTAQSRAKWRDVVGKLPRKSARWIYFEDARLAQIFGVPTASYAFIIDSSTATTFAGRIVVTYKTAADAATGAARIQHAELQPGHQLPDAIVASIKRMTVKQTGTTVEVGFTAETLGGMSVDDVEAWADSLLPK